MNMIKIKVLYSSSHMLWKLLTNSLILFQKLSKMIKHFTIKSKVHILLADIDWEHWKWVLHIFKRDDRQRSCGSFCLCNSQIFVVYSKQTSLWDWLFIQENSWDFSWLDLYKVCHVIYFLCDYLNNPCMDMVSFFVVP